MVYLTVTIWQQSTDKTQLIFSDLSTPTGKKAKGDDAFCAYEEIKNQLMLRGVPEEQICFIQDYKSSKAKQKLFMDVRKGKVRVLIGSTEMMGTGMNVQHKLIALHHLDCPNRPADIEQREGRIIRQGNTNPELFTPVPGNRLNTGKPLIKMKNRLSPKR